MRSSSRRRGEALHPPQSRPSAERTLDAIQPFCHLFPRCRAYSCGVPHHPLLIGRLHCARSSWKLSSRWGRKFGAAKLGNPFSTYTKTRRNRSRPQRLQRSLYVSQGFRSAGITTSIFPGVLLPRPGADVEIPEPHILDWCPSFPPNPTKDGRRFNPAQTPGLPQILPRNGAWPSTGLYDWASGKTRRIIPTRAGAPDTHIKTREQRGYVCVSNFVLLK